jgi:tRNA (guanine-N7-)-methyltransferase
MPSWRDKRGRVRIRQHVNPLGLHYEQFRGVRPVLPEGRPIEVEIGCAEAQFLFERAEQDPQRTYVGLEIRDELVDYVNRLAAETGAPVHAVFCQAQLHIDEIFGAAKVDRVYVNFPDPWFKRKHHARRMVDATLADGIARILRPGGELFVQTDVWDIALDALAAFEPRFENLAGEWTFWKRGNPYGVRSWREQNAEETGLTIWRLLYRAM